MKVTLSNGHAALKDICHLRLARAYEKVILDAMNDEGKVTDFTGVDKAQFELTLKLIESITVGEVTVNGADITEDWILDNVGSKDWDSIEDAAGTISGKWETKADREKKRKQEKTAK